jgi:ABC-2 type transport system permease protein
MKTNFNQFRVVLSFEFMSYLRNKVYIGITIAFVLLIAIGLSLPSLVAFAGRLAPAEPTPPATPGLEQTVHVIDEAGLLPDLYSLRMALPELRFEAVPLTSLASLRTEVDEGRARAVLYLREPTSYTLIERRAGSDLPGRLHQFLTRHYRTQLLLENGLSQEQVAEVLVEPQLQHEETVADSGKTTVQTYAYTYLLLFLLYMTVMMYGQLVASSVASEKSNRAMEMLITSTRPLNLMFGKVFGSGLAGLAQISVFFLSAAFFYTLNKAAWADLPFLHAIFQMPAIIFVFTILFYLLGYFMYAFLYGALGSLASRTEDINTSIMPVILIIMVAMFISIFGMMAPDAGWLATFSFVPFIAPMAMFVRICMTTVPPWQIALSLASMLLTILATGWISSRIYRLGVLMYGKPPRLAELIQLLRQAGH